MKFFITLGVTLSLSVLLLASCTTYENSGNSGMNAKQCKHIRKSCVGGVYDQWSQKNGDLACACNGQLHSPNGMF